MKIAIAERLKPFSHTPGAMCLIPGTCCKIEAFPCLIRLSDTALSLSLTGPVRDFMLQQDLEKNCVYVSGRAQEGFYRLRFWADEKGIHLFVEKTPQGGLAINGKSVQRKEEIVYPTGHAFFLPQAWERLSLGVSRTQDWDLVLRRFDLKEILPVLFGLGQKVPRQGAACLKDGSSLLKDGTLEAFCLARFSHILVPRIFDNQYQGFISEDCEHLDPFFLLEAAAHRVRNLFFRQDKNRLELLPACPFDAGRMTDVQIDGLGRIDLEWASSTLRRAILRASVSRNVSIGLQKDLHSFRVRTTRSGRGQRHNSIDPLMLEAGKTYYLDRFQK